MLSCIFADGTERKPQLYWLFMCSFVSGIYGNRLCSHIVIIHNMATQSLTINARNKTTHEKPVYHCLADDVICKLTENNVNIPGFLLFNYFILIF